MGEGEAQTSNPSTWVVKAAWSGVQGQPHLYSDFKANPGHNNNNKKHKVHVYFIFFPLPALGDWDHTNEKS